MNKYIPPCKKSRTFFDLFKIYSCDECKLLFEDDYYNIGETNVNIYYIERCILSNNEYIDNVMESTKLKLLLKDAILNNDNNIIVWLDKFDIIKDESLLFDLLEFELDVQIIVN